MQRQKSKSKDNGNGKNNGSDNSRSLRDDKQKDATAKAVKRQSLLLRVLVW
jgi:hypothetical protein